MRDHVMLQSSIPGLSLIRRGKVRDIYSFGKELLIVATDRISCFDVVLPGQNRLQAHSSGSGSARGSRPTDLGIIPRSPRTVDTGRHGGLPGPNGIGSLTPYAYH